MSRASTGLTSRPPSSGGKGGLPRLAGESVDTVAGRQYDVVTNETTSQGAETCRSLGCASSRRERARSSVTSVTATSRYTVTYRGRPIGVLLPIDEAPDAGGADGDEVWVELTRLGEEIGRGWQSPSTSAEILSDVRR